MNPGTVLPTVEKHITQEQIGKYAEASGDFNPIHIDPAFAAKTQFGGTIAHGMMVAANISEMMSAAFGHAWADSGKLKIRFRAPVRPGDTVTAFGEVKSVRETDAGNEITCTVGIRRQDGENAIVGDASVIN